MKIAFCTDIYLPQLSGVADSIQLLSGQLKKNGHEVRIYAPGTDAHVQREGDVIRLPSFALPGSKGVLLVVLPFGMVSDMKRFRPDIIHTHTFSTIGFGAVYAAWRLGVPLVGTDHTFPADYLHYMKLDYPLFRSAAKYFAAWYYNRCQFVTAPGGAIIHELRAYGFHRHTKVISNSIPPSLFRPLKGRSALKKKYHIREKAVLLFGRIAIEKNLDFALDIFKEVLHETDADLVVLGDGPHRSALEKKSREEGIESHVRFLGTLRGEELAEVINATDVYLITSTSDTQSMTTLQAMACGLPVVGANAGGIPEYVHDGKTGYIVSPIDMAGYIRKVIDLLKDVAKARKLGEAGSESVAAYLPEHIAKEFEEIYTKCYEDQLGHSGAQ